ncbi:Wzz/FepE/Etk N-terminal domain-containing protein [Staphylococcus xylosus]|uniref:YveK family protein n=1 Tax=Staphylococcus TaxID=1279 RepID=UPI00049A7ECC|nr:MULTISPECIES: Wzz/FepE/Etk N-terminal domain-containing protein [Staphylococcus]AID02731.1 capsule biosynthesis protein CapA [Staphylococcus xylosus]MBV5141288.1 capsule biosynthesis protein CapA [Staphylococcus xylosus]MBW3126125.1 capsule biosynthesis protein CapA [Staphylococcus xylosus]MDT3923972.1 Wzz/FepE/Etk N-terminal domain-containing protein [Staphylococcus saprophyticus]MDW4231429.1 Wzz/FepE/Etk N-terminal domain-containing protein [Staphylococcus saprophyticus]
MENSVDLIKIWRIIKRNFNLIIILPIVGLIIGLLCSLILVQPMFQASTQVIVNEKESDSAMQAQQVQSNIQLVNTYAEIATSPRMLEEVSKELDNKYSAKELSSMISATSETESQILNIAVESANKNDSEKIANVFSEVFSDETPKIMNIDNVSILSKADDTATQTEPKMLVNALLGIVIGLMVAAVVIVLREIFDTRIKNEQDVQDELDIPVLGSIQKFK